MFNKYLLNKVTKGRGTEEKRQKVESTKKEEEQRSNYQHPLDH